MLGLKTSLVAVREEVAAKATRYRQLQKQKKEVQEREFQDLLEQGLNPYEVYRRKDVEREAARQRRTIRDNIASRQVTIAGQLAVEEQVSAGCLLDPCSCGGAVECWVLAGPIPTPVYSNELAEP